MFLNFVLLFSADVLVPAILFFSGAADISEVPASEYEQFEHLHAHPCDVNGDLRLLRESSLLTEYQCASLEDYRARNGNILSMAELAVVDGFNENLVNYLRPFVFIGSDAFAQTGKTTADIDALAAAGVKISQGVYTPSAVGRVYTDVSAGKLGAGASLAYKMGSPQVGWSASASYGRYLGKAVAGHFNARFAQGLSQWSGVSIESIANPSALYKRSGSISPYRGWSTEYSMYGAAVQMIFGPADLCAYADIPSGVYGAHSAYSYGRGVAGLGVRYDARTPSAEVSADLLHTLRGGVVLFGEAVYRREIGKDLFKAVLGTRYTDGRFDYGARVAASNHMAEAVFSFAAVNFKKQRSFSSGTAVSYFPQAKGHTPRGASQLKNTNTFKAAFRSGVEIMTKADVKLRLLTRYADVSAPYAGSWSMLRVELRQDVGWNSGNWGVGVRISAVHAGEFAFLGAADMEYRYQGRVSGAVSAQASAFRIDSWDARIYLYQKDAPGSFNVPAMYGRGYSLSMLASMRIMSWIKLYLRLSYLSYPWARPQDSRKSDSLEAKFQIVLSPSIPVSYYRSTSYSESSR